MGKPMMLDLPEDMPLRKAAMDSDRHDAEQMRNGSKASAASKTSVRSHYSAKEYDGTRSELLKKKHLEEQRLSDYSIDKDGEMGIKAKEIQKVLKVDPNAMKTPRRQLHFFINFWGFDTFIGFIIMLNAVTIGLETQAKAMLPLGCDAACVCKDPLVECTPVPLWVGQADYFFFAIYLIELLLRIYVYGIAVFRSHWVKFDLFLVSSSTLDIVLIQLAIKNEVLAQLMLVRMLRLARLARAIRLMVQFQTLWQLVQGLMHSVNTLLWTFLLVMILMYILSIVGMEFITVDQDLPPDHPYNIAAADNFGDFGDALLTLLQLFTLDSIASIYRPLIRHKVYLFFYFIGVILLLSIALMNLVTAVMVNSSLDQASEDKEVKKAYEAEKKRLQMIVLSGLFLELDEDKSGELDWAEIDNAPEDAKDMLKEIAGTDDLKELFDMLDFDGGGTLGTLEFCDGVLKATNSDKPMELGRLVKQCSAILADSRETVKILKDPAQNPALLLMAGGGDKPDKKDDDLDRIDGKVVTLSSKLGLVQGELDRVLHIINEKSRPASTPMRGPGQGSGNSQRAPGQSSNRRNLAVVQAVRSVSADPR
ncbi:unnamed protein product [Polarella glacialis]|uniref:EF-hand domain-containing protein n=1 Tax=Polarella glacialis TaxID=89957 RepID=A0A813LN79_POLGL|nr:unnamed protein product [Polarella glacialis]